MLKKLSAIFFISLFVANLFILAIPQNASAANSDPAKALTRRKLHTFLICLNTESLNMGNVKSYDDLYKGPVTALLGGPEWIVVGFDRDSTNGVMSCSTVVRQGIKALGVSDTDADAWLLKELTGNSDFSSGEQKIDATKLSNLVRRVTAAKDAVESPSGDLRRERILPLAKVCYDMKPRAEAAGYDFKESGNFFYRKSDGDIKDYALGSFVRKDQGIITSSAYLGNIKLDGWSGNGYGFGDSFYPIGSDIEQTKGYEWDAILSCQYITDNHEWLFQNVSINDSGDFVLPGGKVVGAPPQSSGNGDAISGALECDNGGIFGFIHNPLNWLLCPFVNGLKEAIGNYDDAITNLLKLPTEKLFDREGNKKTVAEAFHNAWSNFRIIAMVFLVLIALIMIISQAIAVGPFDAYTIKHVIPRLLIAVILISLSWELMRYAVELSNILGLGIRGLIYTPFKGFGSAIDLNIGGVGLFGVAGGTSLALLGPFGVLLLALTGIIAVVTALVILVLREMLVMFLVMVAPIAIVCSILPNTQKVWKMWTSYFSRALLLFVLFSAVVATGHAFALMSTTLHHGTLGTIIAFVAYFGPYFMLPTIFKMSGGAMAAISGAAYGATQGIRGGLKNARRKQVAKKTQEYGQRAQTGHFFKGDTQTNLRGKLNKSIQKATLLSKAGLRPTEMRNKLRQAALDVAESGVEEYAQKSSFARWSGDDAKLSAARYTNAEDIGKELERFDKDRFAGEEHREDRERAITQIMASQRETSATIFQRARVRAQAKTGTGYQDPVTGRFNSAAMMEDINDAYGDDRNGGFMALSAMKSDLAQSGQIAGLASYTEWGKQLDAVYRADTAPDATRESRAAAHERAHKAIMANAIVSVNPGQAVYGKQSSAREMGLAHWDRIQAIRDSITSGSKVIKARDANGNKIYRAATFDDLSAAVADAAGVADAFGATSPNNASAFVNELFDRELTIPGGEGQPPVTSSVRDFIDTQMAGNEQFHMRRSTIYGSALKEARERQAASTAPATTGTSGIPQGPIVGGPGGGLVT